MAVQQSQTNGQLEALHAENAKLHTTIEQLAGERDRARQANVQLQLQSLNEKAALDADSNAPRVWCLQAEAEVIELKGEIDMMKQRSGYRGNLTTTSAALGPLSFPALGRLGGGLTTEASPQLRGGMSGLGVPRAPTLPLAGRGAVSFFAGPVMEPAGSTRSLPQGRIGKEPHVFTKPVFGGAQRNCGASPRAW